METITRNQAICRFYGEEYTEENVTRLSKRLDEVEVDICYLDDPTDPCLIWKIKINQNPSRYHRCTNENPKSITTNEICADQTLLTTPAQIVQFLNTVYLPFDPNNQDMYECQQISHKQIFVTAWNYTSLFDEKTISSFTKWCSHKKLSFLKVAPKRRQTNDGERLTVRFLFVLKKQFIDSTVKRIAECLPTYQTLVQSLKDEGYTMIGYARKSPTTKDNNVNRTKLLEAMCNRLKERSAVDHIFVSVCSKASDPFNERDKTKDSELLAKLNASGDTQDMLQFIVDTPKVCLVALDHAGLTTNTNDLSQFLRQNQQVKKIIIDKLPHSNEIVKYDSTQLLHNQEKLEEFDCRRPSYKRST